MNSFIQEFEILGLFGYKDFHITFNNNILILIGENGFGKTTILNAINYTIQGCYKELLSIKFDKIRIVIGNETFEFEYSQLREYYQAINNDDDRSILVDFLKKNIEPSDFELLLKRVEQDEPLQENLENEIFTQLSDTKLKKEISKYLARERRFGVFASLRKKIKSFGYKFMYEPTYRRVEVNLSEEEINERIERRRNLIYGRHFDEENQSYAMKVIKFGMNDVNSLIKKVTNEIRESSLRGFAKVSGEMIRQLINVRPTEDTQPINLDKDSLKIILDRTGNNLTPEEKDRCIQQIESGKNKKSPYLNYFLRQLYDVYESLKQYDIAIKKFIDVCNKYLVDKKFVYDEGQVDIKIYRCLDGVPDINDAKVVNLEQLSSGEKQIVSIFAQTYLRFDNKFVMFLDEPELSLSIYWQENILQDILDSNRCAFLMVVTHSPFIFRNSLVKYTVGLQEFIKPIL